MHLLYDGQVCGGKGYDFSSFSGGNGGCVSGLWNPTQSTLYAVIDYGHGAAGDDGALGGGAADVRTIQSDESTRILTGGGGGGAYKYLTLYWGDGGCK